MQTVPRKITVWINPVYTCSLCGRVQIGDSMSVEREYISLGEMAAELSSMSTPAQKMPVGWASFYNPKGDDFRCSDHQ
jgi:hypothetical protein